MVEVRERKSAKFNSYLVLNAFITVWKWFIFSVFLQLLKFLKFTLVYRHSEMWRLLCNVFAC